MRVASPKIRSLPKGLVYGFIFVVVLSGIAYALPLVLAITIENEQSQVVSTESDLFPVTVDPKNKIIVENASKVLSPHSKQPLEMYSLMPLNGSVRRLQMHPGIKVLLRWVVDS
jgi:predicted ATPase